MIDENYEEDYGGQKFLKASRWCDEAIKEFYSWSDWRRDKFISGYRTLKSLNEDIHNEAIEIILETLETFIPGFHVERIWTNGGLSNEYYRLRDIAIDRDVENDVFVKEGLDLPF